ncbi:phospholipid-transporting ATPase IIA [Gracilaria domingensis]|nr:phospholipid-transporting ATPase IIA [Gracilaria domingensis]
MRPSSSERFELRTAQPGIRENDGGQQQEVAEKVQEPLAGETSQAGEQGRERNQKHEKHLGGAVDLKIQLTNLALRRGCIEHCTSPIAVVYDHANSASRRKDRIRPQGVLQRQGLLCAGRVNKGTDKVECPRLAARSAWRQRRDAASSLSRRPAEGADRRGLRAAGGSSARADLRDAADVARSAAEVGAGNKIAAGAARLRVAAPCACAGRRKKTRATPRRAWCSVACALARCRAVRGASSRARSNQNTPRRRCAALRAVGPTVSGAARHSRAASRRRRDAVAPQAAAPPERAAARRSDRLAPNGAKTRARPFVVRRRAARVGSRHRPRRRAMLPEIAQRTLESAARRSFASALSARRSPRRSKPELSAFGLDLDAGSLRDNLPEGVVEPAVSKKKIIQFATEAALAIIRIDDLVKIDKKMTDLYHTNDRSEE